MVRRTVERLFFAAFIIAIVGFIWWLHKVHGFSIETWKQWAIYYKTVVNNHYILAVCTYIISYALIVVSGVPLFIPATLLAGYLFGWWLGLLYAVIAANLGAVCSFLLVRYLLNHWCKDKYTQQLERFKKRMAKQSYAYMLSLHLAMIFPYAVINTLAALSDISLLTFLWTTVLGSLPFIAFNVFAGQQLHLMMTTPRAVPGFIWFLMVVLALLIVLPVSVRTYQSESP